MRSGPVTAATTTLARHARACRHPALLTSSSSARLVTNVRARPASSRPATGSAAASDNGTAVAAAAAAAAGAHPQHQDQHNSWLGYHSAIGRSSGGGGGGGNRHRWSGVEAVPSRTTAVLGVARGGSAVRVGAAAAGWEGGMGGVGGARAQARGLSSYLADAVRENAANHCIERVVNGSLDASVVVDTPTVDVDDFVYDIDFRQKPSRDDKPVADAPDPFELVSGELRGLSDGIKSLVGTDHPVLNAAAKYFFELDGGKKIRPAMVILMSQACNSHAHQRRPDLYSDTQMQNALQLRLAEITEMIHAASLFHDDVIDEADTRRGVSSVNKVFGNKLAILAGDFLLARSSMSLARLRSLESVELMSAAIEHLVKGEVLQMRPTEDFSVAFEHYVRKNYYKTGSLMANSCKASAVLGSHDLEVQNVAFEYGKRVGLAFQLVDDILDFEGNAFTLGKPALNDLRQGLATAPVLLAAEQQPGLTKLIKRKFKGPGDVDEALSLVHASDGIARAKDVAVVQAEKAMAAVLSLGPSPPRDALVRLAHKIVNRNH